MAKTGELSKRTRIKFRFKHDDFDFFFQWILGGQTHSGSEVGESFYAASEIIDGDPQSWQKAWTELAQRSERRARSSFERKHFVSAREAYFRAYTHHRAPLIHMSPQDPRYRPTYERARSCFQNATKMWNPAIESFSIPFEGGALAGYFLKPNNKKKPRKTLMMFGGGDTFVEDLYYYIAPAGLKRDYNVFIIDLPGQGTLPVDGLVMRADAEVPMKAVVDYVLGYPEVDGERLAAFGISVGGYLIPRAVGHEKRINACIVSSAILNVYEMWIKNAGLERIAKMETSWLLNLLQKLPIRKLKAASHMLNTYVWRWGVDSVSDLLEVSKQFVFDPSQITCPVLNLIGEQEYEHFEVSRQWAHRLVDEANSSSNELVITPQNEGADGHAIGTNLSLMSQLTFDWLDEVFE